LLGWLISIDFRDPINRRFSLGHLDWLQYKGRNVEARASKECGNHPAQTGPENSEPVISGERATCAQESLRFLRVGADRRSKHSTIKNQ